MWALQQGFQELRRGCGTLGQAARPFRHSEALLWPEGARGPPSRSSEARQEGGLAGWAPRATFCPGPLGSQAGLKASGGRTPGGRGGERRTAGSRGGGSAEGAPRAPLKGPLMFANPGLSGGRGPGCWPNKRRLKGGRGGRCPGRPAPDPGGPGTPGEKRRPGEAEAGLARPPPPAARRFPGPGRGAGASCRRRAGPLRSVTPAFSAAPGPAPAPR